MTDSPRVLRPSRNMGTVRIHTTSTDWAHSNRSWGVMLSRNLFMVFPPLIGSGNMQGHEQQVDQFDADERRDDPAHTVEEQVLAQHARRAQRTVRNAP